MEDEGNMIKENKDNFRIDRTDATNLSSSGPTSNVLSSWRYYALSSLSKNVAFTDHYELRSESVRNEIPERV